MTPESKATLLLGEDLSNDASTRSNLCPKCGGGDSKEKSFVLSKDPTGFLYWRCFRSSCGFKGSTGGGSKGKRTVSRESRPLTNAFVALTPEQAEDFSDEYGIEVLGRTFLYYCPDSKGYVFQIYSNAGVILGHQVCWYDGRSVNRLNYPEIRNRPFMGFYKTSSEFVVVVEDCLSAIKVLQRGVNSVALLGTQIDWERAYNIREVAPKLILALDRGTLPLQLKYKEQFQHLFPSITIWTLDKDLKYVSRQRITEAISLGKTDFISKPREG